MPTTEFVKATLSRGDKNFEIEYQLILNDPESSHWHGEFFIDGSLNKGEYDLVTADGRCGTILVTHVYHASHGGSTRCRFEGIGELSEAK